MNTTLLHGDCLTVMPTLDAESVDSIVTDPPYGLSFMGKDWDHGIPGEHFWLEALRVAKPGAHLLAFGGTRTFHRLAVAIEDAGWEMRDTIGWLYSTGFPKSHNFGCKCRGGTLPCAHEQAKTKAECDLHTVRNPDVPTPVDTGKGRGEVLQSGVPEQGAPDAGRTQLPAAEVRSGQPSVEGRSDVLAKARELQADQVCPLPDGVSVDGTQGRLHHGASPVHGADDRATADTNGSGASQEPRPTGQPTGESGTVPRQPDAQDGRRCAACGGLIDWQGWGTALKPAWEPIIVARKPLIGTVAANVQKYGTGAINIDGCRIASDDNLNGGFYRDSPDEYQAVCYGKHRRGGEFVQPTGRWPANLIHDGSQMVMDLFPESKGIGGNSSGAKETHARVGKYGLGSVEIDRRNDSGSAARFFYCAKASKADRDDGCEGLDEKVRDADYRQPTGDPLVDRLHGCGEKRRNHHPTVKPTSLMRYLCRLVTPPNGTILDPFMGSGSTGKAALKEGFNFIGIEKEAEYIAIAKARIGVNQ